MKSLPHHYNVVATADPDGDVILASDGLDAIPSAPPVEFGGPGDRWSPETLLVAAVADCFVLTFRAIATASELSWKSLRCDVEGRLERIERVTRFTGFVVRVTLEIPNDSDEDRAHRILEKAEESCLITNSLSSTAHLDTVVVKVS